MGERAAWGRCTGALLFALGCWEAFLRIDSVVLAPATKTWLFPLLAIALASGGAAMGLAAGGAAVAALGVARARRVRAVGFPLLVAGVAALTYALLAFHHLDGHVDGRVLALIALAGVAWSIMAAVRGAPAPAADAWLPAWLVATIATLATAALVRATLVRPDVFYGLLRRNSLVGRVLGHGLAAFPPALPPLVAPPPLAALAVAAPRDAASVVILSIDALRADALGAYGAPSGRSPRLDGLARQAVVFADAYTQSPNSAPSMATLLTGVYPFRHRVRMNRMPFRDTRTRLPEVLAAAGYATAGFVTNPNFDEPFEFARGFGTYRYLRATLGADGLVRDSNDPEAVDAALAWAGARGDRPFFLWVHLMAPHSPYIPPPELQPPPLRAGWFDVWNMQGAEALLEGRRTSFDGGVYLSRYTAEVASADRLAGRLFDGLAAAGVFERAHVIVIADHGEAFGESDVFGHGRSLDRVETRVPFLWRLPGAGRAATVSTTAQLADVMPTLLGLLGLATTDERDGRDLGALVAGDAADDDGFAFTEGRYIHSMGVRGLLYGARSRRRSVWLDAGYPFVRGFDRTRDPEERAPAAIDVDAADPLHARLVTLARAAQDALASPLPKVPLDPERRERLRALGYAQ